MSTAKFSEDEIQAARNAVADDWRAMAKAIREKDHYAPHVTEAEKDACLRRELNFACGIEIGIWDGNFTVAQRIHMKLTGEYIALLP